jgi:fido (protein-threonine AMPylation protein)
MDYPDGATPLDPNELGGLRVRHITTRGELDELEQVNIESGLRWLARQRSDELRTLMDDARFWANHRTHAPLEAAIRLHHRLTYIHPFTNGNGRHARIMADAVLDRIYKTKPIDWAGGYDLQRMNDRRNAYVAALKAADRGDLGPLMAFIGPRGDL